MSPAPSMPNARRFISIEPILKGWSDDEKYAVTAQDGKKLLLRVSPLGQYEQKKDEYDALALFASCGFTMSSPIEFGICDNGRPYMLLAYVEGEALEDALPHLGEAEQYRLGREAGRILRSIHRVPLPEALIPKTTKTAKKLRQLDAYLASQNRYEGDGFAVEFIKRNIHKIWSLPPALLHGDFHPGNLILTPEHGVGVIDFNRYETGDPYEEFYKLESFGTECSIPYCLGQLDEYFCGEPPKEFWDILAVYVAHSALYSIKWAEKFGPGEIATMRRICEKVFSDYDGFTKNVPKWYWISRENFKTEGQKRP